jgi:hypothetical protein
MHDWFPVETREKQQSDLEEISREQINDIRGGD